MQEKHLISIAIVIAVFGIIAVTLIPPLPANTHTVYIVWSNATHATGYTGTITWIVFDEETTTEKNRCYEIQGIEQNERIVNSRLVQSDQSNLHRCP